MWCELCQGQGRVEPQPNVITQTGGSDAEGTIGGDWRCARIVSRCECAERRVSAADQRQMAL